MLSIGSDHAGFELKQEIIGFLKAKGVALNDRGTYSPDSTDYPEFAHAVASDIEKGTSNWGILICGSANGVSMSANKHPQIRCAICWEPELAELAKQHNDANIIALPARFISTEKAKNIVEAYMKSKFEGGRHQRRVEKIAL